MIYYEADLIVEMKPEAEQIELLGHTKCFINRVVIGFDHEPTQDDIEKELTERYPEVNLVETLQVYDASFKAETLSKFYGW